MIVAGIGYQSAAQVGDLIAVLDLTGYEVDALASLETKIDGPLSEVAAKLGLPTIAVEKAEIAGVPTPTCSERMQKSYKTGSLAEAVALVAAGPGAQLIVQRIIAPSGLATIALAKGRRS